MDKVTPLPEEVSPLDKLRYVVDVANLSLLEVSLIFCISTAYASRKLAGKAPVTERDAILIDTLYNRVIERARDGVKLDRKWRARLVVNELLK